METANAELINRPGALVPVAYCPPITPSRSDCDGLVATKRELAFGFPAKAASTSAASGEPVA